MALGKRRSAIVEEAHKGLFLDACVRALFTLSWNEARAAIETGKVSCDGEVLLQTTKFVRVGQTLLLNPTAKKPRPETDLPPKALVHTDAHVVVVEKPSGISTVPYDESEVGTLDVRVKAALGGTVNLGVVHRIDKETSGLVVFTRTWLAKQKLASQFRAHTVHRRYFALVQGHVKSQTIRSYLLEDRGDGLRGSSRMRGADGGGVLAISHVECLETFAGASLIACKLETGKTHQIRIHLSELGHPLLGERVYVRNYQGPEEPAPRLMLHAAELGFDHPKTEAPVRWESPLPRDMQEVLTRLRG